MNHFVIINEYAEEGEIGVVVLNVTHSFEDAQVVFRQAVESELKYANEHNFKIYDKKIAFFDAGTSENYNQNHTKNIHCNYMKAINILWDVDCKEDLENLPKEIEIPDGMTDEYEISDYISEVTGFCHSGFIMEVQ